MIWDNNEDIRVEHCDGSRRGIQQVLDACREERRPYVVIKDNCSAQQSCCSEVQNGSTLSSILVPVTMLEEEVYKAEVCTYLARKTGAHLILLRANDYGSKAIKNTQRIITHIQTIAERTGETITYEECIAKGDSFHIHKELHTIPPLEGEARWGQKNALNTSLPLANMSRARRSQKPIVFATSRNLSLGFLPVIISHKRNKI